jgi:hypothetical protein
MDKEIKPLRYRPNPDATATCNWCGEQVKAETARYVSGRGTFYHHHCLDERDEKRLKDELANTRKN